MRRSEAQNHRCAICGASVDSLSEYEDDPYRAVLVSVEKNVPKTSENSVVVCVRCGGNYSNWPNLSALYDAYVAGTAFLKTPRIRVDNRATVAEIRRLVEARCKKEYLQPPRPKIYEKFCFAPVDKAPDIAIQVMIVQRRQLVPSKRRSDNTSRDAKRMLCEAQNHRCCYCGCRMTFETRTDPDFATIEHVHAYKDGGQNEMANKAIACFFCNNLRDRMNVTAEEYADWAADHLDEIARKKMIKPKATLMKIRHQAKRDNVRPMFSA